VAHRLLIRPEREADHPAIAEVVRAAFVRRPDEVAAFVERIRASEHFVPELALVAEDDSEVIAHVMLSWVGIEGGSRPRILNLTPMSVRPDRQRQGVGARLIRGALGRTEAAGEPAVMVEGIPGYYPRFGFEPAIPSASSPRIRRSPTRRSWSGGWPGTPPTWPGGSSTRPRSRRSAASARR